MREQGGPWRVPRSHPSSPPPPLGSQPDLAARLATALDGGLASLDDIPTEAVCNALSATELRRALRAFGAPAPKSKADALSRLRSVLLGTYVAPGSSAAAAAVAAAEEGTPRPARAVGAAVSLPPPPPDAPLRSLTVRQLRAVLDARGLAPPTKATKGAMLAVLEEGQEEGGGAEAAAAPPPLPPLPPPAPPPPAAPLPTTPPALAPLTEWTMAELRAELRARGDKVGGSKADLVARLLAARAADGDRGATGVPAAAAGGARRVSAAPRLAAGEALLGADGAAVEAGRLAPVAVTVELSVRGLDTGGREGDRRARLEAVLREEDAAAAGGEAEGEVADAAPPLPARPPLPRVAVAVVAPWPAGGAPAALDGVCTLLEQVPAPADEGAPPPAEEGPPAAATASAGDDESGVIEGGAAAAAAPPAVVDGLTATAWLIDAASATAAPAAPEDMLCSNDAGDVDVAVRGRAARGGGAPRAALGAVLAALAADPDAVAFPVLTGAPRGGAELLQALEDAGVPFVGPTPAAAVLCDDRPAAAAVLAAAGLRTLPTTLLEAGTPRADAAAAVEALLGSLLADPSALPPGGGRLPLTLKPASRSALARPVVARGAGAAADAAVALSAAAGGGAVVVEPFLAAAVPWRVLVLGTDAGPVCLSPVELDRCDAGSLLADAAGEAAARAARAAGRGPAAAAAGGAAARADALAAAGPAPPPHRLHLPARLPLDTLTAIRAAAASAFEATGARDAAVVDGWAVPTGAPPPPAPAPAFDIDLGADAFVARHPDAPDVAVPMPEEGPGLEAAVRARTAAALAADRAAASPAPPAPLTEGGGHAIMIAGVDAALDWGEAGTAALCAADAGVTHAGLARHVLSLARARAGLPSLPPPPPPDHAASAVARDLEAPDDEPSEAVVEDEEGAAEASATAWAAFAAFATADPEPIAGSDGDWAAWARAKAEFEAAGGSAETELDARVAAAHAAAGEATAASRRHVAAGADGDGDAIWNRAVRAVSPEGLTSEAWPPEVDLPRGDAAPLPPLLPSRTSPTSSPPLRVWILAGGDGPGADAALAGGRHAALALAGAADVAVEAFVLAPRGGGAREGERAAAALARRALLLEAGVPEASLTPGLALRDALAPPPTDEPVSARCVWGATPSVLLRTTVADAAAAADADAGAASTVPRARTPVQAAAVATRAAVLDQLDGAGVAAAGGAWGVTSADRAAAAAAAPGPLLAPAPRRLDVAAFAAEAAAAHAVVLLSLPPGDPDAAGPLQAALRAAGALVAGPTAAVAAAAADAGAVAAALAGLEVHSVSTPPRWAADAADLAAAAASESGAADVLARARAAVGAPAALLARLGAGGGAGARPARVADAPALRELAAAIVDRATTAPDGDGGALALPAGGVEGLLFEPDVPDDGARLDPDTGDAAWTGRQRWLRVSVALVGERGAMRALAPTAALAGPGGRVARATPPPPSLARAASIDGVRARCELAADALGLAGGAVLDAYAHADAADVIIAAVAASPPLARGGALLRQALAETPPVHAADALRELARLAADQAAADAAADAAPASPDLAAAAGAFLDGLTLAGGQ